MANFITSRITILSNMLLYSALLMSTAHFYYTAINRIRARFFWTTDYIGI